MMTYEKFGFIFSILNRIIDTIEIQLNTKILEIPPKVIIEFWKIIDLF